jgi:membrane-bound lytic murein transglycosylase D
MRGARSVLPLACIFAAACATAPVPQTTSLPQKPEITEYRRALESAYSEIVARQSALLPAPSVDLEAAASMTIPEHRSIRGAVAYFSSDLKPSVQESFTRSARYKKLIDRVLDEAKLPKGLAYLPVIESAYLPTLTSRAGAHGIWQFMAETAREYGQRVDWWIDERADPERSTRAAAAYLKDLYRQFGDWSLALAAYNAGPARVHRALDRTGSSTFWDLLERAAIPRETRGYVPTFFATLIIAGDPPAYGFRLGEAADDAGVQPVEVEGPLSLRFLAEFAGLDEAELRDLNPSLRRGMVPPGNGVVRLPSKAAEIVAARAATLRNDDANVAVCSFTLREGDTVKRLARAIGVSVDTVLAMNNLRASDRVRRGDAIYLPVRARELGNFLSQSQTYYAVRKGDTMYSIAKRFELTVDDLREVNQLSRNHKLHPGEKLRVSAPRAITAGGM